MWGVIDFLSLSDPHTKEKTQHKQKNIMEPKPEVAALYVHICCALYVHYIWYLVQIQLCRFPDLLKIFQCTIHCIVHWGNILSKSGNHQSYIWTKYQNAASILICREEQILVLFPFLWLWPILLIWIFTLWHRAYMCPLKWKI